MRSVNAKIGIIGMGAMGANFARNLAGKKIKTVVFNRTAAKTDLFIDEFGNEFLSGTNTLKEFVNNLELPRKIILLIKPGYPIDKQIESLIPLLSPGDTIIDFGNSHYRDTNRRNIFLKEHNLMFFGCGISGGEKGALNGPSLMLGGPISVWKQLQPVLEEVAAKDFDGNPCVAYMGPGGAGHYVKMVHNGIEYGVMQTITEAYDILQTHYQLKPNKISAIFEDFNKDELNSYLLELTAKILKKKEADSIGFIIDKVKDQASQKGTGSWTVANSLKYTVPVPTICASVTHRTISSKKEYREKLSKIYQPQSNPEKISIKKINEIKGALFSSILLTYIQGFSLIETAVKKNNWQTQMYEIARIWQGGCIIRAQLLKPILGHYMDQPETGLLENGNIVKLLSNNIPSARVTIASAIQNGIAVPAMSASLAYLDAITRKHGPANLIQAQRDAFGAHTYERIDKKGIFHTEWI